MTALMKVNPRIVVPTPKKSGYGKPKNRPGFVYLVKCNEFIKIGLAENPAQRMAEMDVGNPYPMSFIRIIPAENMLQTEQAIHNLMAKHHHVREWFKIPDDALKYLLSMTDEEINQLGDRYALRWSLAYLESL